MGWCRSQGAAPARLAVILAIANSLAAWACGKSTGSDAAQTTIAVTVQPARLDTLRETLSAAGLVVPAAAADQTVSASEPAEIVELPKAEGQMVHAGDVLVRFDIASITSDLQTRQLDVADAAARVETARAEATRLGSLHDRGLVARNTVDASKSALAASEVTLTHAKAQLEAAKALQERTIIRARFAGLVAKVWHKSGDLVAGGSTDPVLRVVDPTRLQVAVQVSLAQLERIQPGQPATIKSGVGADVPATVAFRQAPAPGAAAGEVRLGFALPSTLTLDAPVQIDLLLEERRDVIVVPQQAVQKDPTSSYVWLAGDDGQAHRRDVRVGLVVGGMSQIVTGVTAGDRIILTGISELNEGTPITWKSPLVKAKGTRQKAKVRNELALAIDWSCWPLAAVLVDHRRVVGAVLPLDRPLAT